MVIGYIIPITLVAVLGISGYLVYRFLLNDFLCNRSVNATLREFNIKKTQYQIIKEYHAFKGKEISDKEILRSEEHTSELQSRRNLVCRLLLEKK